MFSRGTNYRVSMAILLVLLGSGLTAGVAQGGEGAWRISGMMAAEVRGFADSPAYAGQSEGGQGSWILSPGTSA